MSQTRANLILRPRLASLLLLLPCWFAVSRLTANRRVCLCVIFGRGRRMPALMCSTTTWNMASWQPRNSPSLSERGEVCVYLWISVWGGGASDEIWVENPPFFTTYMDIKIVPSWKKYWKIPKSILISSLSITRCSDSSCLQIVYCGAHKSVCALTSDLTILLLLKCLFLKHSGLSTVCGWPLIIARHSRRHTARCSSELFFYHNPTSRAKLHDAVGSDMAPSIQSGHINIWTEMTFF